MDNFFEILIYLFIIVSFVNSFLKKKKKNEEKAAKAQKAQTEISQPVFEEREPEPSGKDILDEIQSLFNPPVEKPREKNSETFGELWKTEAYNEDSQKEAYQQPIESENEMVTEEHSVTLSEHTPTLSEHTPTLSEHKLPGVEKPKETIITRLLDDSDDKEKNYNTRKPNPILLLLKNEMSNNDSLKRYIVISEILGKPKALRR